MLENIMLLSFELAGLRIARCNLAGKFELEVFDWELILCVIVFNRYLDCVIREERVLLERHCGGWLLTAETCESSSPMHFFLLVKDRWVRFLVVVDPQSAPTSKLGHIDKLARESRVNHRVWRIFRRKLGSYSVLYEKLLVIGQLELMGLREPLR